MNFYFSVTCSVTPRTERRDGRGGLKSSERRAFKVTLTEEKKKIEVVTAVSSAAGLVPLTAR